ncbi:hypothetical protein [Bradyrhizobium sp. Ghvi]|uniref:hypothetical protein n=1 Tax=Bradyrhizobium sp. Ghvi TaxID=1855319 RepID=UPI000ACCE8A1|nr:hypothetical protein [Bradyrhizobium sp. Ghvi]
MRDANRLPVVIGDCLSRLYLDWHEASEPYVASDCELGGSAIEAVLRFDYALAEDLLDQIVVFSAGSELAGQLLRDGPERPNSHSPEEFRDMRALMLAQIARMHLFAPRRDYRVMENKIEG